MLLCILLLIIIIVVLMISNIVGNVFEVRLHLLVNSNNCSICEPELKSPEISQVHICDNCPASARIIS